MTKQEKKAKKEACIIEDVFFFYNNKMTNISVHSRIYTFSHLVLFDSIFVNNNKLKTGKN
jgi:hypothetical protein